MKKKVLAICGSTRATSSNLNLIHAIADLAGETFDLEIFDGLTGLPHFNPDIDHDEPPQAVTEFRQLLKNSDGILICTPEYAMGAPGTLKNALDWTVSSSGFSHKPVALITASLSGIKAHESLLATLQMIEARVTDGTQLLIPFVKTKVNAEHTITDAQTLAQVQKLILAFADEMNAPV
ncbi:MAG: NAD(P)H-dependent oxidoreductase [Chitinophagaceae bacterium]